MPADTEAVTGARRVARTVLALIAVTVMVGTGLAWGKIRSFEGGIFHMSTAALGGGGQDGAIDILLVGMDSRTDAHGNPLSEDELAALHAGDDVSTNTDTIILVRIPNNGKSATAISIPRDSYVKAPGLDKTKINGVYGQVKLEKMKELVEEQGMDPAEAEPKATEAGREALIKTVADLTGVTVDHYAEIGLLGLLVDHRRSRRRRRVPQRRRLRTPFGCRLSGRLAEAGRPAGAQLRAAAPRPAARRPRPGGAPAGGDGLPCPPSHFGQDADQSRDAEPAAKTRSSVRWCSPRAGTSWISSSSSRISPAATSRSPPFRWSTRPAGATTACSRWSGWTRSRFRTGWPASCTIRTRARPRRSRTHRSRPPPTSSTTPRSTGWPLRCRKC